MLKYSQNPRRSGEMADAQVLGTCGATHGGSIPLSDTNLPNEKPGSCDSGFSHPCGCTFLRKLVHNNTQYYFCQPSKNTRVGFSFFLRLINMGVEYHPALHHRLKGPRLRLESSTCPSCGASDFPAKGVCPQCKQIIQGSLRFTNSEISSFVLLESSKTPVPHNR